MNYKLLLSAIAVCVAVDAEGKVTLPHFITDSMVVQQRSVLTLTGKADGRTVSVTASWSGKPLTATADAAGRWSLRLPTPKAGGPYTITFDDGDKTVLGDIYSGEVWLCSGQSNMEMPVGGWGKVMNYEEEIRRSANPDVRLLQIKKQTAINPAADTEVNMGGWRTAQPATVENFSSIAYFYAREMARRLGLHVGVIDCTWGGTPAEAWTSFAGVRSVPGFEKETDIVEDNGFDRARVMEAYGKVLGEWTAMATKGEDLSRTGQWDGSLPTMPVPCEWEKTALPDFDGIVWMQRKVTIPQSWEGKGVTLSLAMVDDDDVTYFNGEKIAEGSGYNVNRVYIVPARLVKGGEAVITVRVSDYGGGGGIWGKAGDMFIQQGDEKLPIDGDWSYRIIADFSKLPPRPMSPENNNFPAALYNAMLSPLHVMPVKGVLWYQGCANVGRAEQYAPLFRRLITDWRALWGEPKLPFYFVQLAGYLQPQLIQPESEWAALRQAQADALTLPATHMATAIDIGNPDDIHPKNKQEVARRLALLTRHYSYGQKAVVCEAPVCRKATAKDGKVRLAFNGAVSADGTTPKGFIAHVKGGGWIRPEVRIEGSRTVCLAADGDIDEVRYDWADYPDGNLRGETGLPVTPFKMTISKQ